MPSTQIGIAEQDVAIAVCMLSKMKKKEIAWWAEDTRVAIEILRLCVHMRQLKRPMLVLGGSAKLWGYTNDWDRLVEEVVAVAWGPRDPYDYRRELRLAGRTVPCRHPLKAMSLIHI